MPRRHEAADLFEAAIADIAGCHTPATTRVLDFGCGAGRLLRTLLDAGYDAYGCDVRPAWIGQASAVDDRAVAVPGEPCRLPFADGFFDVVISTSVLEHVHDKLATFRELHRVLRPGGHAFHLFPSKGYLPVEPHLLVPFVNHVWPHCPRWWLAIWAWLGVRNKWQSEMTWREVVEANVRRSREGLSYWSNRRYRRESRRIFERCDEASTFFLERGYGGLARLARRLPARNLLGWLGARTRMVFLVQRKQR